ncbi:uncharacterized protein LOC110221186 [Phascolarctos cinereus]|uniref:Uncharacterized protein LOC110221186 n=1 Tax=Phascolarctos cinereus TaxID=38626 RepID=A0A6P5LYH0_PHACI|nr:uncharacterized protein LOC110221186 [Phascolarctos cinereus]
MDHSSSSLPSEEKPKILASDIIPDCNNTETGGKDLLPQEKITLIKSTLQEGRLEEVVSLINKMIEDMDNAVLNIALTGESGAGKSTFINAFRGVGHEDEHAASTGVVETTTNVTCYEHPELPNVKLWDLPGIGTLNFKPENYLEKVNFSRYDFFLIISSSRFRINDVKLAQKIREMRKKFYFVRTKVDIDLHNERRAKPRTFKEENVLQMIKTNCLQHLQKIGIEELKVFLISSFELESYDFPKLKDDLAKELPEHKRHVFFLSLPNISEDIIEQKKASIQERIWLEALKAGAWAAIPLVGVFKEEDIAQLKYHLINYQRKFGVDDASLLKTSQASNKPLEEVKALIKSPHLFTVKTDESIGERLLRYAELFFSVNGGLLAPGLYYRKTYCAHLHFLETVANDAKILLSKLWETSFGIMEVFGIAISGKDLQNLASNFMPYYKMVTNTNGDLLPEDTITWIQSALQEGRLAEVASRIRETLEASENVPLNIAVTGESGSGKSAFINGLRGIGHEEKDSASTGVVETTMKATPYEHPKYPNVKLWDLPGIGTPDFHPDNYLHQVQFNQYDFFIILSASRFTTNHVKLVQEIRKRKKKFYFVRTMVDIDLYNERKSKPKSFSKERVLQRMRDYCLQNLHVEGVSEAQVFLVSNFDLSDYDFPKLEETLLKDLPAHKRHTYALALSVPSEAAIERKKAALRERIWLEAFKNGLVATVPSGGFFINNLDTLDKHLKHYRNVFGVDDASLLQVAQKLERPVEEIKATMKSLDLVALIKEESAMGKLLKLAEGISSAKGFVMGAGFHFGKTYFIHWHFLDVVAEDGKSLLRKVLDGPF